MSQISSLTRREANSTSRVQCRVAVLQTRTLTCGLDCTWLFSLRKMLMVRMRPIPSLLTQRTFSVTPTRRSQGLVGTIMSTLTGMLCPGWELLLLRPHTVSAHNPLICSDGRLGYKGQDQKLDLEQRNYHHHRKTKLPHTLGFYSQIKSSNH